MQVGWNSCWNLFGLLILSLSCTVHCCPSTCVCKWKGGKETVECLNKGLSIIPYGIKGDTQVLDLQGSNLHSLAKEEFQRKSLLNLQKIYLSRCQISILDDRTFAGLTNLVELDLSQNRLQIVPTGCFYYIPSLTILELSRNPITEIGAKAFVELKFLTTLELSNCNILRIDIGAFLGLQKLQWLRLDGNQLKTLSPDAPLSPELHGIDLYNNPWICNCHLKGLKTWLVAENVPTAIEPRCTTPIKFMNQTLRHIPEDHFACAPKVLPSAMFLDKTEGENISLECSAQGTPLPRITWTFRGKVVRNNSATLSYTSYIDAKGSRVEGKHVYFVHENSSEDRKWSELSISHVSALDNGTFLCTAENDAGQHEANFTVRVIIPVVEPPEEIRVILKWEDYLVIGGALACLSLALLVCLCCGICICRKSLADRRKKHVSRTRQAATGGAVDKYTNINGRMPPNGAAIVDGKSDDNPDVIHGTFLPDQKGSNSLILTTVVNGPLKGYVEDSGYDSSYQILSFSSQGRERKGSADVVENLSIYDPGKFCTIRRGTPLGGIIRCNDSENSSEYPIDYGLPPVSSRVKFAQSQLQHTRSFDDSASLLVNRQVQTTTFHDPARLQAGIGTSRTLPRGLLGGKRAVRFASSRTPSPPPTSNDVSFVPLPPDEFSDEVPLPPPPPIQSTSAHPLFTTTSSLRRRIPDGGSSSTKRVTILLPRPETVRESPDEGIVDCGPEGTEV